MIELPEANTLARQIEETLIRKKVQSVVAASSPHKFAWYHGDPAEYPERLLGNSILSATAPGGMVEIKLTHAHLLFSDGLNLRFHQPGESVPLKQQLLLTFADGSALSASVQMYGGLSCWVDGDIFDNAYYLAAKEKPSPLDDENFDEAYFLQILTAEETIKLNLKAALATHQRVPGLGNGVLQDILWHAKLSPRCKVNTLSAEETKSLFLSLKQTLADMTSLGGRETEKDLFGNPGGYKVIMSSRSEGKPCPECGAPIVKEAYLGGSVYYCRECQRS